MTMACLPMYDWPEAGAEAAALWSAIRVALPGHGLPGALCAAADPGAVWRDPSLVFSQTCWGPLRLGLIDQLEPLAQPDYTAFAGGRGPFYRSAVIARPQTALALGLSGDVSVPTGQGADLPPALLQGRRLAVNERASLSGYLALQEDLGADPCALAAACVFTGAHRASVMAVAEGRADIAAIDCRSWDLAGRFEPAARGLIVVGWTAERPGLPYVSSRATDPALRRALRDQLLNMGCHPAADGRVA